MKEQLRASFVEHFKENHENIASVYFQFYNPKLIQEKCYIFSLYYTGLCTGCSTKEIIGGLLCRAF